MRRIRLKCALVAIVGAVLLACVPAHSAIATHSVRKGESLADIARRYNVPLSRLIQLNHNRFPRGNPDILYTGTKILVPVKTPPAKPAPNIAEGASTPKPAPQPASKGAAGANTETAAKPSPAPSKSTVPETPPLVEDRRFPPKKDVSSLSPEARKAAEQQIYGTITDTGSHPIEGASVVTDHGDYTGTSKTDGSYFIAGVEQGTYSVTASKAGFNPRSMPGIVVKQGERSPASFQLVSVGSSPWSTPWLLLAGLIIAILAVALFVVVRMISSTLNAAEPRDSGLLRLVATRDLGKNARVHWLRAGERDLFVTEGVDVHMLPAESLREPEALPSPGSLPAAPTRRPRKNGPGSPEAE